jgi:hypothetical protein
VRQLAHAVEAGAIRAAGRRHAVEARHLVRDAAAPNGDQLLASFHEQTRRFRRSCCRRRSKGATGTSLKRRAASI